MQPECLTGRLKGEEDRKQQLNDKNQNDDDDNDNDKSTCCWQCGRAKLVRNAEHGQPTCYCYGNGLSLVFWEIGGTDIQLKKEKSHFISPC